MTKEVYIALIQKDIAELDMIAQSLYETDSPSPTIIKLAQSKASDVIKNLSSLAENSTVELQKKESDQAQIQEPVVVEEPEVIEEPEVKNKPVEVASELEPESIVEKPELIKAVEEEKEEVVEEEPVFEPIEDLIFEEESDPESVMEVVPEPEIKIESYLVVEEPKQEEKPVEPVIEEPKVVEEKPVGNVKILTSRPVYYKEPEIIFERVEPAPKKEPVVEEKKEDPAPVVVEAPIPNPEPVVEEQPTVEKVVEVASAEPVVEEVQIKEEPVEEKAEVKASKIDMFAKSKDNSFISSLSAKKIDSIKKGISMGDRFRFQRELFLNNPDSMNTTIEMLDSLSSAAEAEEYLSRHFSWNMDDENVADFLNIVARRFL